MARWLPELVFGTLGISLGLGYGWKINPVKFVDTTPASLRADFRADFVLMTAERYHATHDSDAARRELAVLGGSSAAATCADALQAAQDAGYSQMDLGMLQELAHAMQALSPAGAP
jgi:hypothetical protein